MEKKIQSYVLIFGEVIYGSVDKLLQFGETVKKRFEGRNNFLQPFAYSHCYYQSYHNHLFELSLLS